VDRQAIKNKYNGLCAYCGIELSDRFHVDHIRSKRTGGKDEVDNYNPSCPSCNIRKGTATIELFRSELKRDLFQLNRDSAKFRLAVRYGLIALSSDEVIFYFEKLKGD